MGNVKRRRPHGNNDNVGYANPPRESMWKPGQSGNPKGRPKGTPNFKTDVQATLRALVQVTRDGKPQKLSTQQAVLFRLLEKGLSAGNIRALGELLQLARIYNNEDLAVSDSLVVEDESILRIYRERLLSGAVSASSNSTDQTTDSSHTKCLSRKKSA